MKERRRRGISAAILMALSLAVWPASGAASKSVPEFSHIIVVVLENKEANEVIDNPLMPNLNRWAKSYALLDNYYAVNHPSLPNYIAMIAGDFFGIQSDCIDCFLDGRCLADLVESGGRTWKTYQEGLPRPGFLGPLSGRYSMRHNPFAYFRPIRSDRARCERSIVPLTRLKIDLEKGSLPDFALVVPDLCNSSHDCGPDVSDRWLGRVIRWITASPAFDARSLIAITFDEGTTDEPGHAALGTISGGRVATVLISPLVKRGSVDRTPYTHYSLLKTIATAWGLEELGHAADPGTNVISFPWRAENPPAGTTEGPLPPGR